MTARERILMIRLSKKIHENPAYAERIEIDDGMTVRNRNAAERGESHER